MIELYCAAGQPAPALDLYRELQVTAREIAEDGAAEGKDHAGGRPSVLAPGHRVLAVEDRLLLDDGRRGPAVRSVPGLVGVPVSTLTALLRALYRHGAWRDDTPSQLYFQTRAAATAAYRRERGWSLVVELGDTGLGSVYTAMLEGMAETLRRRHAQNSADGEATLVLSLPSLSRAWGLPPLGVAIPCSRLPHTHAPPPGGGLRRHGHSRARAA